jgi:hypothetical protein
MFLGVRLDARRLARMLRKSLLTDADNWKIDRVEIDGAEHTCLANGRFQVALVPRRLRINDALYVYCDGAEVWLPLLPRLRVRNAARWRLIRHAKELMDEAAPLRQRRIARRGRSRNAQPA